MDNELEIWFDNFINKRFNNKILFIDKLNKEQIDRIRNTYTNISNLIKINFLDDTGYGEAFPIESNSLVYLKSDTNFTKTDIFKKDIIYVSSNIFIQNFESFLNSFRPMNFSNYAFEIKGLIYNIEYFIIEKVSIKNIIENKEELLDKIRVRKQLLKSILGGDVDKIGIAKSDYYNIILVEYLDILKNKNILITSLGHYLYRIFTLDFTSTTTRAGLNIKKDLNSKSKPFTYKNLTGKNVNNHNLKAYDLNINQIEIDTKKRIAKSLLSLKKEKLDYKTISKVTELPEKDVLKLIKKIQFLNFND